MKKSSSKPKGATSYKETVFGVIPRSKLIKLELQGTKRGLEFIYELISKNKNIKITPELICRLHKISFCWIFPKWSGKYRTLQVTISGKETPPFYKLPELVLNFCEDLQERLNHLPQQASKLFIIETVKLLAWFQHKFVYIHPFRDYNGRTARMLTLLILLKLELPPVEIKAEKGSDRKRYIAAMQEGDKGNLSLLENLISQAISESFKKIKLP